jgi:glycosyltransferase involved in cell wall biosynthesis
MASYFESKPGIELHIISPQEHITKYIHFELRGVHYHFFNSHIPFWGRHWPGFFRFDYWTGFASNKIIVKKIVNKIKPDIIHLHGAELAYYSSTVLQFKNKFPVLVTIQGFISHANQNNYQIRKRVDYETKILKSFRHFGYRTHTMGKDIKEINPDALLHWHHYPSPEINNYKCEKKYDLVFFARLTKDKGIEDLLKAVSILKKIKPDISLLAIGGANSSYKAYLVELATQLNLTNNVLWAGFLPTSDDVHKMASAAKISILPTYNELISGTIIESLFLKLPVVAYDVGSIHEVNEQEEIISLVEKGNIDGLVKNVIALLSDEELIKKRAEMGYKKALELLDNSKIFGDLLKAYKEVISDFKRN